MNIYTENRIIKDLKKKCFFYKNVFTYLKILFKFRVKSKIGVENLATNSISNFTSVSIFPQNVRCLHPFVCFLIYLRRHARYSEARRNALASDYVPTLQRGCSLWSNKFSLRILECFQSLFGISLFDTLRCGFISREPSFKVRYERKLTLYISRCTDYCWVNEADISIRLNLLLEYCIESSFPQVTA